MFKRIRPALFTLGYYFGIILQITYLMGEIMNCTNCGHELQANEKFCTECGQPVRMTYKPGKSSTKKKKKPANPFKKFLKVLLIIFLVIVGLVVAFILSAMVAAFWGGDDIETETTAPITTRAPITTPAPIETPEPTPEATPEPTPEPTAGLTNAQILEMTGAMICTQIIENGFESNFIHSDNQLIIGVVYDMSFDACKSMGAAYFALEGWEETLIQVYNSTVEVANTYGATNYYVHVNLWSREQKTIMSCSSAGIDYNIK